MQNDQMMYLVLLSTTFLLLLTERLRTDVVAGLIVISLALSGILTAPQALSGFASEPAICVASVFVLGAGIYHTGISQTFGRFIGHFAGRTVPSCLAIMMPCVALLSAFSHHVTATAVMMPVLRDLAKQRHLPAAQLLMPMSFAASLGTTTTLVSAPAFLLASALLQKADREPLHMFDLAPIGITLVILGTLFMMFAAPLLLPNHTSESHQPLPFRLQAYFTELSVLPQSRWIGRTVAELETDQRYHITVVDWLRDQQTIRRPYGNKLLEAGDQLLIYTNPEELLTMEEELGLAITPIVRFGQHRSGNKRQFVQAVLAPDAELNHQTLAQVDFHSRYGATVVALWRQSGWLSQQLAHNKLQAGDILVLQGDQAALQRMAADPTFLMLLPLEAVGKSRSKAGRALLILLATVLMAASSLVPVEIASMTGALAMVLSGCLSLNQAYSAIDARIFVFIAGAIPLGLAMQTTGTADLIALWLQQGLAHWSEHAILALLFAIVAIATQFMSDAGTTAIFAPVAIALAQSMDRSPEPYAITVAMAAVAAFLTPIGHHGNLLIYGPGGYRFTDFVRVGTPLTFLIGLVVVLMAPMLWPS